MTKVISPADLIPMDIFTAKEPIKIDLVYQQANHERNIFGTKIYTNTARLWLHKDLAKIVVLASRILLWHGSQNNQAIWHFELKDGLRTTDSQAAIQETNIVKANPQWQQEPNRLLSPPGAGGHPRGMAIDIAPVTPDGLLVDMGTEFDEMTPQSARSEKKFSPQILQNRILLEKSMTEAAILCDLEVLPLPAEWWDFRFFGEYYAQYTPLSDADLPPQMQMTNTIDTGIPNFPEEHFEKLAQEITSAINQHNDYL